MTPLEHKKAVLLLIELAEILKMKPEEILDCLLDGPISTSMEEILALDHVLRQVQKIVPRTHTEDKSDGHAAVD